MKNVFIIALVLFFTSMSFAQSLVTEIQNPNTQKVERHHLLEKMTYDSWISLFEEDGRFYLTIYKLQNDEYKPEKMEAVSLIFNDGTKLILPKNTEHVYNLEYDLYQYVADYTINSDDVKKLKTVPIKRIKVDRSVKVDTGMFLSKQIRDLERTESN